MLLPDIAQMLGVTIDELLSKEPKKETLVLPEEKRKNIDLSKLVAEIRRMKRKYPDLYLVEIESSDGDTVKIKI